MRNLILLLTLFLASCSDSLDMRVATFNIRYRAEADAQTGDDWDNRKASVAELILAQDFDIVGTQEGDQGQIDDLLALMPDYDCTAHPYGGKGDLHTCATFYKRDKYELLDSGVFWYSETPDQLSIGWDASDTRICSWGKFRDKASGKRFVLFNSHFYWRKVVARANSGAVLIDKVKKIAGDLPAICTGDFNSTDDTPQVKDIRSLLNDAYMVTATPPEGPVGTDLGGGNFLGPERKRIDYIFTSDNITVYDYTVITDKRSNDHYPSDHLPIVCNIGIE